MIGYVDSSVLLRFLLKNERTLEKALEFDAVGSSELIRIECQRVLYRYRLEGLIDDSSLHRLREHLDDVLDGFSIVELTDTVKKKASDAFPTVIGTLDALHLSSAILWQEQVQDEIVILTFDRQMAICAGTLGIHTYPEESL